MRVTVLGHASVFIEAGRECILVDPIFDEVYASGTLCHTPSRDLDAESLIAATTLIVVTHIHLDHFHPPTLGRFPRELPIVCPPHEALVGAIRALGFTNVTPLEAWARFPLAGAFLLPTPSDYEIEELGVAVGAGATSYWHMSDAIVTPAVGARVRETLGPVSLASVKFQPLRTLIAYQRGLASTMLDRDDLTSSFEAACASEPAALFPYYAGFAFHGEHAWANRHISPYRAGEIAVLLRERLGAAAAVHTVLPGDVFEIAGREVAKQTRASPLVSPVPGADIQPWEPIDPRTLRGVRDMAEVLWVTLEARRLLAEEVLPWVQAHLDAGSGLFDAYRAFKAIWQCVIHLGGDRRLHHVIDFRTPRATLSFDHAHPLANVFSHVSGGSLRQVLRREAGPEVFWMAGGYRMYEKILYIEDGRFRAPPWNGWELFERLPDPLTHFLRRGPRAVIRD